KAADYRGRVLMLSLHWSRMQPIPAAPVVLGNAKEAKMADKVREHMEVIGADGVHVGTVDRVEGDRIKLTKKDSGEGSHKGHHHTIPMSLAAQVVGNKVRL